MADLLFEDIFNSNDRYKLYLLKYHAAELNQKIELLNTSKISAINLGKELSLYIDSLDDFRYLTIDIYDFLVKLLDDSKTKINGKGNNVLGIYNLGILLEPSLELNAVMLFKEFSKTTSLIILWENQIEIGNKLVWPTQSSNTFLDFSDIQLKELKHEI